MLLRRVARPLFASWFVSQGVDALRHPAGHVEVARTALERVRSAVPAAALRAAPAPVSRAVAGTSTDAQLRTLVQAHGAAVLVAGVMLAVGRAPRTAALALAGLTVPLVLADLPVGGRGLSPQQRAARRDRFVRALSSVGGAVIAGVDLEGRPGVSWRLEHARADRAALRAARSGTVDS